MLDEGNEIIIGIVGEINKLDETCDEYVLFGQGINDALCGTEISGRKFNNVRQICYS